MFVLLIYTHFVACVIVILNFLLLQCIRDIFLNHVSNDLIPQTNYEPEICGNFEQASFIVYGSHGVPFSIQRPCIEDDPCIVFKLTASVHNDYAVDYQHAETNSPGLVASFMCYKYSAKQFLDLRPIQIGISDSILSRIESLGILVINPSTRRKRGRRS